MPQKSVNRKCRYPGGDKKWEPPEYNSKALEPEPACNVFWSNAKQRCDGRKCEVDDTDTCTEGRRRPRRPIRRWENSNTTNHTERVCENLEQTEFTEQNIQRRASATTITDFLACRDSVQQYNTTCD